MRKRERKERGKVEKLKEKRQNMKRRKEEKR